MDKVFYNEGSAAKLGWEPDWFGAKEFDEELVKKITQFQSLLGESRWALWSHNVQTHLD